MIELIRQGDVLLKKIKELPKSVKSKDNILVYGEVTGHAHKMGDNSEVFTNSNGNQFVLVKGSSELMHEDHDNIQVSEGVYEVVIQREFDIVEGTRQVMD